MVWYWGRVGDGRHGHALAGYYCVGFVYERLTVGRMADERGDKLCAAYE